LHFLEELPLCEKQRVLQILIFSYVKNKIADDPRLVDVNDVDVCNARFKAPSPSLEQDKGTRTIILVKKGNRLDSLAVDDFPRFFFLFFNKNGKYGSQAHDLLRKSE